MQKDDTGRLKNIEFVGYKDNRKETIRMKENLPNRAGSYYNVVTKNKYSGCKPHSAKALSLTAT